MFSDGLAGDYVHQDDQQDAGRALEAVRYITIDKYASDRRHMGYIRENIIASRLRDCGQPVTHKSIHVCWNTEVVGIRRLR
jgi:hypothetical protein